MNSTAYDQGRTAYRLGFLLSQNRYANRPGYEREASDWARGWQDAKDGK